jgi:hypothetical protein
MSLNWLMACRAACSNAAQFPVSGPNTPFAFVLLLQHRRRRCHGGSERPNSQKDLQVMEAF